MKSNLMQLIVLFAVATNVLAVKEYLFKTCDSSGFCNRNKHFASSIKQLAHDYIPKYSVSPGLSFTGDDDDFILSGVISKLLPTTGEVLLPFKLSLLEGNNLRITIDEARDILLDDLKSDGLLTHRRYNETSSWAFTKEKLPYVSRSNIDIKHTENSVQLNYGTDLDYTLELQFYPIKLTILYKSEVLVIVNDQNFLNLEHFRSKTSSSDLHPEESDFNLFHDSFEDSSKDKIPFGPESIGLDFTLNNFTHLYGVPEHADTFNLKDTTSNEPYRMFNVDIFEYDLDSRMPMYGSIPLLLAVKPEASVGIFWINGADTFVSIEKSDDRSSSHWVSENGVLDFMIIIDRTPELVNKNYGLITGYSVLPQMFALGYHQCRWNYNDVRDVLEINELMDTHQIPYDTIWLDIEYAESKKYFTWLPENFPDPNLMLEKLDRTGRNLVVIVDPHIKTGYNVSDGLVAKKITMNNFENETYYGHCWPGESVWIDTLNKNSQQYWDLLFQWGSYFMGKEATNIHLWNDMNEPSVFNGPETTSPKDNIHAGGWEHRSIHNLYGLSYHEATYDSLLKRQENSNRQRPFILTRSYFSGSQRTAAMWTGDNMCRWDHLKASIPMILTSNVVGMPFAGADVGGFFGNPSEELLTRWYQTGIWYPFFRAHAHIDSLRREPWMPGDPYTSIIRDAIKLRYSLLSVIYTAFREASLTGAPIIRPLFYDNLENQESYDIEDEFFVGNSGLLVKPVTDEGVSSIDIFIPSTEKYYDFTNGVYTGNVIQLKEPRYISKEVTLEDTPVFLRGGSIIERKERYRRLSKLMRNDPYTLIIALDDTCGAHGKLYIDDGESFAYENGEYLDIIFSLHGGFKLHSQVKSPDENFQKSITAGIEKIIILSDRLSKAQEIIIEQNGNEIASNYTLDYTKNKLIINRLPLRINSDWSVSFVFGDNNSCEPTQRGYFSKFQSCLSLLG